MRKAGWLIVAGGVGAALLLLRRQPTVGAPSSIVDVVMEPVRSVVSGPRGIRNNNPGNIVRTSEKWRGMSLDQSGDSRFVVFDAPVWGLRALARILRKYNAAGLVSVSAIINRWAPPVENDTGAYAAAVARALGVSASQPLVLTDEVLSRLMAAIVQHENGQQPYAPSLFAQAIEAERAV